ncbi:MAG: M23 family metallopeptidase [Dethiobacteria bacterium]|jgi:murein DD-endopeptidase MepM/ murein hydrolase activator NlpD
MKKAKPVLILLIMLCFTAAYFHFYSPDFLSFAVYSKPEPNEPIDINGEELDKYLPESSIAPEQPASNQEQEPKATETENETKPTQVIAPQEVIPPQNGGENTIQNQTLIDELSFLQSPLPGARITTRDSQLPGAPRPYRNGTHEGLDYYNGYCGISINYGDPVFAAGEGVLIRIDHNYKEPDLEEREEMLRISATEGDTPEDILDILRGRQIWILHPNGTVTRYAHLSKVNEELVLGDQVEAGAYIGNIGNSGTSDGAEGSTAGAHLHFEIWPTDHAYLGKGLSPAEVRNILEKILE